MQRQRFITTIKNVIEGKEKKKLKSLVRFHSANKIDNCNEREEKIFKSMYRTSQNIRIINACLEKKINKIKE